MTNIIAPALSFGPSLMPAGTARGLLRRGILFALAVLAVVLTAPSARAARSGDILGEMHEYYTWSPDEDLLDIARGDDLGLIELMVANPGVDPWLPSRNIRLVLPTMHIIPDAPRRGIVINTAEMRLYYFDAEDGPMSFALGVGRDGYLTPTGTTKIVRKKEQPSWTLTPSEVRDHPELPRVVPPGPDNPLGEYAMYLGWPTYLIHGTNTPWGIGRRTSRGCIRMYPEDVEWLFQKAPIGTQVTVVDQPVKLGWKDGELYIEVQPSTMQVDRMEETSQSPGPPDPIPLAQQADRILAKAGDDGQRLDWPTVEKALADRVGYPIRITLPAPPGGDAVASQTGEGSPAPVDAAAGSPAPTAAVPPVPQAPVPAAPAPTSPVPTAPANAAATMAPVAVSRPLPALTPGAVTYSATVPSRKSPEGRTTGGGSAAIPSASPQTATSASGAAAGTPVPRPPVLLPPASGSPR